MHVAVVIALAALLAQEAPPAGIGPGAERFGLLAEGGLVRLHLLPGAGDELTLALESIDFDPLLVVVDLEDREVARDEDSGPGDAAWATLERRPDVAYTLLIGSQDGGGGRYRVEVRAGREAPPALADAEADAALFGRFAAHAARQGDPRAAATMAYGVAEHLVGVAEYAAAEPLLRQAREHARQAGHAVIETASEAYLGKCVRLSGRPAEALELLESAWEHRERLGQPAFDCLVLENLGETQLMLQRRTDALATIDRWIESAGAAGLTDFLAVAHARRARVLELAGDRERARTEHEAALSMLDAVEQDAYRAQILLDAGRFASTCDRFDEAVARLDAAAALPTTWEMQLEIRFALGRAHIARGRYAPAERCLAEAERLLGERPERLLEPDVKQALAELAFATGDLALARDLAEEALDALGELEQPEMRIDLTAFLGSVHERMGAFDEADAAYARATELAEQFSRPEWGWRLQFDRGRLARERGAYDEAVARERDALRLADLTEDPSARASCANDLAYTLSFTGELDEARALAQQALETWTESGEVDQVLVGPLHTLAVLDLAEGRLDDVDDRLARADALIEREDVTSLRRRQAAGVRSAFVLWGEVAQDLVARRLASPEADRPALIARGLADAGRWKARALLERLPGDVRSGDVLAEIRAAVGPSRALVEYAAGAGSLYAYLVGAEQLAWIDLGPVDGLDEQVSAFLAGMTDRERLAPADEIARRGSGLYERLLAPVVARLDADVEGLVVVPTARLARLPLEALVVGAPGPGRVVHSFSSLAFVADRYDVVYGPSTPALARLHALGPRPTPGRALVMGDPWYASEDVATPAFAPVGGIPRDPRTSSPASFPRLLATRAEAVEIATALLHATKEPDADAQRALDALAADGGARSGRLSSRRFDLRLGRDATFAGLGPDLRQYDVLHIAAHGVVDTHDPLRSGLVLSYDGVAHDQLTLVEIRELQLDADLVVLSACETARGNILEGEGVQSIANGFLEAGARAVIASLWQVDDEAARETMSRFYGSALLDERGGGAALRQAKMLRDLKRSVRLNGTVRGPVPGAPLRDPPRGGIGHPYYWAPFVYIGAVP